MLPRRRYRGRTLLRYTVGVAVAAALHAPLFLPAQHGGAKKYDVGVVMELQRDLKDVGQALAALEKKAKEEIPPPEPKTAEPKGDEAKKPEPAKQEPKPEAAAAPPPPPPAAAPPPKAEAPKPPPPAKGRDVPDERVAFREAEHGKDGDTTRVGPKAEPPKPEPAKVEPPKPEPRNVEPPRPQPKLEPAPPPPAPPPPAAPPVARPAVAVTESPALGGDVAVSARPLKSQPPRASAAEAGPHPGPARPSASAGAATPVSTAPVTTASAPAAPRRGTFSSGAGPAGSAAPQSAGFEVPTIYTQAWSSLDQRIAVTRYFGMQLIAYPPAHDYFVICNLATKSFEVCRQIEYVRNFSNRILHQEGKEIDALRESIAKYAGIDTGDFVFAYFIPVRTANYFARRELAVCRAAGFEPAQIEAVSVRFVRDEAADAEAWLMMIDALRTKDGRTIQLGERENRPQG